MTEQADLFGNAPPTTATAIVRIKGAGAAAPATKAQKTFNRLVAQIESRRGLIAQWQEFLPLLQQQIASDFAPLEKRIAEQKRALLRLFDAAHGNAILTKRERSTLSDLICELAQGILEGEADAGRSPEAGAGPDAEVVAIHDRHSDVSHEALQQQETEMLRAITAEMFGDEFADVGDAQTPDEFFDAVSDRLQQRAEEGESTDGETATKEEGPREAKWASSARQQAKAAEATRSVRDVYRKLASALHPDRETDAAERDRKTTLMQRVNVAYERKDLLQLLSLQIEIEQIDADHLSGLSSSRLAHYIAVLKEQVEELDQELEELTAPYEGLRSQRNLGRGPLKTTEVKSALLVDLANLRRLSREFANDLEAFRDLRQLKGWLKYQRVSEEPSFDEEILEALSAMTQERRPAARKGRGGRKK